MKIIIKDDVEKINFKLFLPTRYLFYFLKKSINKNSDLTQEQIGKYDKISKKASKILKAYVKENGHFIFIDIESESSKVYIKI
jgi:hypothetical protein